MERESFKPNIESEPREQPESARRLRFEKEKPAIESAPVYRALERKKEKDILEEFTPEQQVEIKQKQQILSSLAYFIGKDFKIPVELNDPGAGWHWDFQKNVIRIDPRDLLEKPMDYLRFVISHEGGHRRISRADFIPPDEWRQPGFSFMMNAIEDPRDNNFVAESYPKFREQMSLAYQQDLDFEAKVKQKAGQKLGYQPRFIQAGFEYIKQWFREAEGKDFKLSEDLHEEVRRTVQATLASANDSWLRYPSRQEADNGGKIRGKKVDGEAMIKEYAKTSYEINRDEVWPEFKKLIDADMEDQKMQELLKDMQKGQERQEEGGESGGGQGLPQELKDKLTPEEQRALQEAIEQAIDNAKKEQEEARAGGKEAGEAEEAVEPVEGMPFGEAIDLKTLPEELKQKIKEYIESLPEDQQKEIAEKAQAAFKEFEDALNEELQGKLSDNPEKKAERGEKEGQEQENAGQASVSAGERVTTGQVQKSPAKILGERVFSEKLAEIEREENAYEKYRREVLPLIDQLEAELRQIFVDRRVTSWKGGFKGGKRIDIKKRIQEKAKDVPVMESHAWQRRERPQEKDYAISLLVDVSGSMYWDDKSKEALKSIIVLGEVLNRLGVNVEILGFNDDMKEYQTYGEDMSKGVRDRIGEIINDAASKRCNMCRMDHNASDIGWATEVAAERLAKQKAAQKFLITLSDYQFEESPKHPADKYELGETIKKILEKTDAHLIGLGIGRGTEQVETYYPNSITNVRAKEMAGKLAGLIKKVIANYDKF